MRIGTNEGIVLEISSHIAFTYAITIFVDNPQLLIKQWSDFIEDIARTVY